MKPRSKKFFIFAFLLPGFIFHPATSPAGEDAGNPPAARGEIQPAKKDGFLKFGQRWNTHSYIEMGPLFDHYRGTFNQDIQTSPVFLRIRRGGDWKYVAFHFTLAGTYSGSLDSSTATITEGGIGFVDMNFRLNGILPVLYGVMLQGGIINETWAQYADYKIPLAGRPDQYIEEYDLYLVNGFGPNLMLSFCPIKFISLNFEYSVILWPTVEKHGFETKLPYQDANFEYYFLSGSSFSTWEIGLSVHPLKYLSINLGYGEKKMSHRAILLQPGSQPTVKDFRSLNSYLALSLSFTY